MNMLRLFESATIRQLTPSEKQFLLLHSIRKTIQNYKGDKKKWGFIKFFVLSFMIACTAPPPIVHSSGSMLLNSLIKQNTLGSSQNFVQNSNSSSNLTVSETTYSSVSEADPNQNETYNSDFYVIYARSEFTFFVGDWIEIQPAETKNILNAQVVGKLPEGLAFEETTMTVFGSVEFPLKKTQIKIKARAINKSNYVTKFYLTVEEKTSQTPD